MSSPTPDAVATGLQTVGSRILRMIARGGEGRVIALFPRSFYFATEDDIACCGGPKLGAGPLNALASTSLNIDTLKVGTPGSWRGARLYLGDDMVLDAHSAMPWRPRQPSSSAVTAGLVTLARLATTDVPARSIGKAIPALVDDTTAPAPADLTEAKLVRGLRALVDWLQRNGDAAPPPPVIDMIGLGAGLTPSGDDAIGGALIVLHQFGRSDIARKAAALLLPLARDRTSTIAYAHLDAAADGEGAEALHEALAAIGRNVAGDLTAALQRLDGIGHSSGWDGLTGAVAALIALHETRKKS